jgi:hypothetical protein
MSIIIPANNLGFYLDLDDIPVTSKYRDTGDYCASMDDLIMRSSIHMINSPINSEADTDCYHILLSDMIDDSIHVMDICDTIYHAMHSYNLDLYAIIHNAYFNIKYLLADQLQTQKDVIIVDHDDDWYINCRLCYSGNVIIIRYIGAVSIGCFNYLKFEVICT